MSGRDSNQSRNVQARRRRMAIMGGSIGALVAAAAMATGSAAPAKADLDTLLDPIIQPLITSFSDAIAGFDPAAAADLTSWGDSLLSSLNSLDLALPAAAEPAASPPPGADIPITMNEVTEPAVNVAVNGGSQVPVLVDTGSSGLVIPWYEVGLSNLAGLQGPFTFGVSGYSGGVDYLYVTTDTSINYDGIVTTANTPVDIELISWPTSLNGPLSFDQFLQDDQVSGILGIGDAASDGGPTTSPLEAAGYTGVTVDIPKGELVLGSNSGTPIDTLSGAPIVSNHLTEVVTPPVGQGGPSSGSVYDDVDSGGVYGTIPQSLVSSVPSGSTISVYDGNTLLYSYITGTDSLGQSTAPTVISGVGNSASNPIDSGVEPFMQEPIYLDYTENTLTFDKPGS